MSWTTNRRTGIPFRRVKIENRIEKLRDEMIDLQGELTLEGLTKSRYHEITRRIIQIQMLIGDLEDRLE